MILKNLYTNGIAHIYIYIHASLGYIELACIHSSVCLVFFPLSVIYLSIQATGFGLGHPVIQSVSRPSITQTRLYFRLNGVTLACTAWDEGRHQLKQWQQQQQLCSFCFPWTHFKCKFMLNWTELNWTELYWTKLLGHSHHHRHLEKQQAIAPHLFLLILRYFLLSGSRTYHH